MTKNAFTTSLKIWRIICRDVKARNSLQAKAAMRAYLKAMAPHDSLASIVLSKGTWFEGKANSDDYELAKAWKMDMRPKPKQCFYNAQMFNMDYRQFKYFEGFAVVLSNHPPVHHAWNVYRGKVIDFTLEAMIRKAKREGVIYNAVPLYFGVTVPRKVIVNRIVETGHTEPRASEVYGT